MVVCMFVFVLVCMFMLVRFGCADDFGQDLSRQRVAVLHDRQQLRAGELIPRGSDDACVFVVLTQQGDYLLQPVLLDKLGAREQDSARVLDLIEEELAEVLGVHLGLLCVNHRDKAVEDDRLMRGYALDRCDDVGQLADARGLDDDAVRMVGFDDLLQCLAKVADQRAADTARVHLGDLHTRILEEAAVNADLAELVFDQHDLLALERLGQQALDERGLAGAQEAGDNINFGHKKDPFLSGKKFI